MGKWAALVSAAHTARFSISGRHSAIENCILFRYDHHQKTFAENASTVSPGKKWTTKLSSAGLVYLHYGRDIISGVLGQEGEKPSEDLVEKVFDKVYANFVEEIDANDNGIDTHDGEPRYQVRVSTSEISSATKICKIFLALLRYRPL